MKKIYYISILIILFLISLYVGMKIYKIHYKNEKIEEYIDIEEVDSEEEKIKPSARLLKKINYTKCSHTRTEENEVPKELVNLTKEELQEKYREWNIEKFSSDEIVLIKNSEGFCGEHYILRNNNGYVTVYMIDEEDREKIYLSTDIAVVYLPETDQINLKSGIYIYGKEKLIELLQDFE